MPRTAHAQRNQGSGYGTVGAADFRAESSKDGTVGDTAIGTMPQGSAGGSAQKWALWRSKAHSAGRLIQP